MTPQFAQAGDEGALIALYRACFPEDPEDFWRWLLTRGRIAREIPSSSGTGRSSRHPCR